jgi:hypothetical protein
MAALVAVGATRRIEDEPPAEEQPVEVPSVRSANDLPSASAEAPVPERPEQIDAIKGGGEEVRSGMRAKARELLAWFCCHPEGGTPEGVVEALCPEVDPAKVGQRFWNSVTSLRGRLREVSGLPELRLLDRYGTRYRLVDGELDVDLWRLEGSLAESSTDPGASLTSWSAGSTSLASTQAKRPCCLPTIPVGRLRRVLVAQQGRPESHPSPPCPERRRLTSMPCCSRG